MYISPESIFISLHPGGEHIVCKRVDLVGLMADMVRMKDFHHVNACSKETQSMTALVDSLEWFTESTRMADDERASSEVCCDITRAWADIREMGKPRILVGRSGQGGTLYLAFVPPHVRECTIEAFCQY
jgi:hypothetical protein